MSVECNKIKGWTVRIKESDLTQEDFDFCNDFTNENPQYDFNGFSSKPNQVYFIHDGMDGEYIRLVYAEKTGTGYDHCYDDEQYLSLNNDGVPEEIYHQLNEVYEKLYNKKLDKTLIDYAVWYYWW